MRVGQNRVACLLADHVDRRDNEQARYAREYRGVDHAQALRATHPEAAVYHRHPVGFWTDRVAAGGMVAPGLVGHETRICSTEPIARPGTTSASAI